jgi:PIN domain nuclease of toxin-antitoxin system
MRYIIDTNVFVNHVVDDYISNDVQDVLANYENTIGFKVKFVAKEHLRTLATLEKVEGHNDPSDRLIIAQAITENIPLISSDTKFPKYRKQGLQLIQNR